MLHCVNHDICVIVRDLMKSLADMLGHVLRKTGSAGALQPIWVQLVGELVSRHSRPVRWEGPSLVIACDAEAWKAALMPERTALSQRLATALGESKPVPLVLEVR